MQSPSCGRAVNHIVTGIEDLLTRLMGENIFLNTSLAADLGLVRMEPGQVQQIFLNLVLNARDAMPDGGQITLATRNCTVPPPGSESKSRIVPWVELSVADTGGGMDPETLERAFEPFFTTKSPGRGNGLGWRPRAGWPGRRAGPSSPKASREKAHESRCVCRVSSQTLHQIRKQR